MRTAASLIMIGALVSLSACGEPKLRDLRKPGNGPDEFRIVPSLPLQQPENYTDLPTPATTGLNRTDQRPDADAIVALGGRPASETTPVPGSDAGLVSYVQRKGVNPDIRADLAKEDAAFRKRQARFTQIRLFPEDRYEQAYRRQALDPFVAADLFRRAGVPVPSAPPKRGR